MQWLIDIIKEIIHGQLGYFDRGDPAVPDFQAGDFTKDNAWHTLDVSAIVPEGAVCIAFTIRARSTAINRDVRLRKHGNTNDVVRTMLRTQNANIDRYGDWTVACSPDRKIDYRMFTLQWTIIDLSVKGWWLR